ncbi:MAG: amidohydrolase family protein [Flavobacteriales bacterium]|nr:amidohydrolase family protein [Flavobacteriales bacterium]
MKKLLVLLGVFCFLTMQAQETFMVNGTHNKNLNFYAFINATIYTDYKTKIENGTLLIQNGKIIEVGEKKKVKIPKNAVIYDLKGKFIYPSFIDIYSDYGMPEVKKERNNPRFSPQLETNNKGAYNWNQAIKPETEAGKLFTPDEKQADEYRKLGFGTVLTHQKDGIMRGTSAFVTLGDENANLVLLNEKVAAHLAFDKGSSTQDYPGSLMGAIALIRQTYYDVDWMYNNNNITENNLSLKSILDSWELPQIFETKDKLDILRADLIGDEFNMQYIFKGNGDEYQRIAEIKKTEGKLIVPVNFPEAYDVEDPYAAMLISYSDVKHWELAPYNLGVLAKNEFDFAITAADLKDKKSFFINLQKAIASGLSKENALKALTYNPAQFINQYDKVGSLEKNKLANFIITSDSLFEEKTKIHENWIKGQRYVIDDYNVVDINGDYNVNVNRTVYELSVSGEKEKPAGKIKFFILTDTISVDASISRTGNSISLSFNPSDSIKNNGYVRLAGSVNHNGVIWDGNGQLSEGEWVKWSAIRKKNGAKKEDKKPVVADSLIVPTIKYPNMAYGFDSLPKPTTMLIKNTTVWTNEKEGILKNTDVLVQDGKIAAIGKDLIAEGAVIVDGTNKHLSAGIIDEHSHIAISRGVNECTQAVTAEVSIADVVNPDDINIYRQLAGGVVASQLLHGSCNPIGGQSAIIKLKWGHAPEEMKIEDIDGFIKFALGENVKQSNWGSFNTIRFPQSRMGVEQVYYDAFIRAKEYQTKWDAYAKLTPKEKDQAEAPRIDLELETLNEILNKDRFISCHSYVQSEINMLMHVADSMGFTVNTFTHILEGYKVADKMKKHGAGGATFSDWWAYKFEVNDAIPYNGAIMHQQGIVTAYNSDDAEMGRRLNQEAAKAIKYGKISEEEALKFVTLNPAKLLHLDDRMGSIKVGKDACIVLWSDNPLSIYATVEKTIIDGAVYYDRATDQQLYLLNQKEKIAIIEKMIEEKKNGGKTQQPKQKKQTHYHCDTVGE